MAAICAAVGVPVEVSGGMRRLENIESALAYGRTLLDRILADGSCRPS